MKVSELGIAGAWEITPKLLGDPRGVFFEAFKAGEFAAFAGHEFTLRQANCSVSAAGVVRGVHFAAVPPGQAKYVMCLSGAVFDVVADVRIGSPTFGRWQGVQLDEVTRKAVYLAEGLGHAFMALSDQATVLYLCSQGYNPDREFGVHPQDPDLAIAWPTRDVAGNPVAPQLSEKDLAAPTLQQAQALGLLPNYREVQAFIARLAGEPGGT